MTKEQVERWICDRCGRVQEEWPSARSLPPEHWNIMTLSGDGSEYDLCHTCTSAIHRWLSGFLFEGHATQHLNAEGVQDTHLERHE